MRRPSRHRSLDMGVRHHPVVCDVAGDAVCVLDALDIDRSQVVGMSLGGTLVQLLLDHPHRLWPGATSCT